MKIALASMGDPRSVGTWSGIPAHIYFALQQSGHEVVPIGLLPSKEPWYYNWLRRIYYWVQKKWFLAAVEEELLKRIGAQLDAEVAKSQPDVVVVIHADYLANTTFKQPSCVIHDATFATLVDYYPAFSKLTTRSLKSGHLMYKRALQRASAAVYSSMWASQSAIIDYKTPYSKIFTIPFGANLNQEPSVVDVEHWIAERSKAETCNFLFLGIDWKRKGGLDALRIVAHLNHKGIKSRLAIVGCSPEIPAEYKNFVDTIGFLRKDLESDVHKLQTLLSKTSALILPSFAECYGCVYCEANAFGLPALGRDTGGVPEIIKEGINGLLLRAGESPESFADRWAEVWTTRSIYTKLAFSSRQEYKERLNYKVFITKLEGILKNLVEKSQVNRGYYDNSL
jgi:glycosyltransferase involved in cell wall biosynthesis